MMKNADFSTFLSALAHGVFCRKNEHDLNFSLTSFTYVVGGLLVSNFSLTGLLYLFYVGSYSLSE